MKYRFLSGNAIKILGAVTMVIDHIGYILFPGVEIFRIIGRLSFPLFAFMISEGARYTKNRLRYLLTMAAFGVVCQLPVILLLQEYHFNVFVTFTLSILGIYACDFLKKQAFASKKEPFPIFLGSLAVLSALALTMVLTSNSNFHIDYGFFGVMMPVFASLLSTRNIDNAPSALVRLDTLPVRILCMLIPAIALSYQIGDIQWLSLCSFPC